MSNPKKVTASSGNVFADLGFANPEEELLKAKLVREIRGIIKRRKLTQPKAAAMLGLKQPDVSALVTGRVGKFSIDRLVRCLDRLDYKVMSLCATSRAGLLREQLRPEARAPNPTLQERAPLVSTPRRAGRGRREVTASGAREKAVRRVNLN